MQELDGKLVYAARDLVGFALCPQLPRLELAAAKGTLPRPEFRDPTLDRLVQRGQQHEERFLEALRSEGRGVVKIQPDGSVEDKAERLRLAAECTRKAMREGADVIYQATFFDGRRRGHADFLIRSDARKSSFGDWCYEVWDTKLAREAKAGALLQVLFYDDLLATVQGVSGGTVHLALGGSRREVRSFPVKRYASWYRRLRKRFEAALDNGEFEAQNGAPDPVEHCEVCAWRLHCDNLRRQADHLSLVAGMGSPQRRRLTEAGVATRTQFADTQWERLENAIPTRSREAYSRLHLQARLQVDAERDGQLRYELLEPRKDEAGTFAVEGLAALPQPSPADLFFDIEGDPFALDGGVEYLFGIFERGDQEAENYHRFWSIDGNGRVTREAEQEAFERTIDFLHDRFSKALREDGTTGMHVYHFGAYEPAALKRLAARFGTRERELDELLRAEAFVDLYRVVRQGLRASVESYSIKQLEPLYGFQRRATLRDAGASIEAFERWLELGSEETPNGDLLQTIEEYNKDDCRSAAALRDWLEERRAELERQRGESLPRPAPKRPDASEATEQELDETAALFRRLTDGVPASPGERSEAEQARWILGHLLSWHRREMRAAWWRVFAYREMTPAEIVLDSTALGDLEFLGTVPNSRGKPSWRFRFPPQEHRLSPGDRARDPYTLEECTVQAIDEAEHVVTVRRTKDGDVSPPRALVPFEIYDTGTIEARLRELAEHVAERGIEGPGRYRAARELLLRSLPRCGQPPGAPLVGPGESARDAALRLVPLLDESCLAIQGPPGSGKTTLAATLIVELARRGKRVGVTANSHSVITTLLERVDEEARNRKVRLAIGQRLGGTKPRHGWRNLAGSKGIEAVNAGEVDVAGGTVWFWASPNLDPVDVLFIDEAGQLSLANALVAAMAARSVVLVGDPQQLDQPLLATHPPGTDRSALAHLLGDKDTIPPERGLFLEQTWRLHPSICEFTSELFYDGRLKAAPGCERQRVEVPGFPEAGLVFVPVRHEGCDVLSEEEAKAIAQLCCHLTRDGASWVDRDGTSRPLRPEDVLVIAPYNLQVRLLKEKLGESFRVGTVDKFQGQEAPVVVYSMTSSSKEDAPLGMEFLYSLNRLNVATSRAKCLAIVVASPALLDPPCTSIRQMELANALACYYERAQCLQAQNSAGS